MSDLMKNWIALPNEKGITLRKARIYKKSMHKKPTHIEWVSYSVKKKLF